MRKGELIREMIKGVMGQETGVWWVTMCKWTGKLGRVMGMLHLMAMVERN
jgi:hypothetical protein